MDLSSLRVNTSANARVTSGEAFYFLQGSPQKITKNDSSLEKAIAATDDHLLQFELRFDHLRTYLEGFSTVVNQHASLLNTLHADLQTRHPESNFYSIVQKLGSSSVISDKQIGLILNQMHTNPKPDNTGKPDDSVNNFCNRLELFTHGFSHFHKTNTAFTDRFTKVDAQITQKVNTDDFRGKVKRTKLKLRNKMEDNYKSLEEKIKALEAKLSGRMDNLDRKVDEVEKHTTWRIKDCEELLRSRINDTYVDDALRLLEERLRKEIEKSTFGSLDGFQKNIAALTQRLKSCEDTVEDKVNNLKKNIKDVETSLNKKHDITKFEEFKKEILEKINNNSEKILTVSRKCEPAIDTLTGDMVKVNEEISKLRAQIKSINAEIENILISGVGKTTVINQSDDGANKAEMEGQLGKFRLDLSKLKESVRTLEDQIHNKAESSQLSRKLDIAEFERMMMNLQNDNERLKRLIQSNETLQAEIAKFEDMVDKKLAKFRKILDIDGLLKQVKGKADEDNVSKGFGNTDKKISALSESLLALKKELDQAYATIEKLSIQAFSFSDNASLSTKKMNPLACLSCGNMSKMANPLHSTMGSDGKLYRADYSSLQEIQDSNSPTEAKSAIAKSGMFRDGRERNLNVTVTNYTATVSAGGSTRVRPHTVTMRSKNFKTPSNIVTAPQIEQTGTYRPLSGKK